jgi:hypothetical protein
LKVSDGAILGASHALIDFVLALIHVLQLASKTGASLSGKYIGFDVL